MPNSGTTYRIRTLANGKRVKQVISKTGRITKITPVKATRTSKRLNKRRKKIGR